MKLQKGQTLLNYGVRPDDVIAVPQPARSYFLRWPYDPVAVLLPLTAAEVQELFEDELLIKTILCLGPIVAGERVSHLHKIALARG